MARSSVLVLVACLVFATGSASAALTAPQIVTNINILTSESKEIQPYANQITIVNGPLLVFRRGPFTPILAGFANIVQTGQKAVAQIRGTATLSSDDCQLVASAFRDFVAVHQAVLNTLIEKAGLFSIVPEIGQPVFTALRQIESVVNSLAYSLMNIAEGTCKTDIDQQNQSFQATATLAESKYYGLIRVNNANLP